MPEQIGDTSPCNDEEKLGGRAEKGAKLRSANATELRIRRLGRANRVGEQIQEDDLSHQQVLAAILGQTRFDKHTCMTNDGKLTLYVTPWAELF